MSEVQAKATITFQTTEDNESLKKSLKGLILRNLFFSDKLLIMKENQVCV